MKSSIFFLIMIAAMMFFFNITYNSPYTPMYYSTIKEANLSINPNDSSTYLSIAKVIYSKEKECYAYYTGTEFLPVLINYSEGKNTLIFLKPKPFYKDPFYIIPLCMILIPIIITCIIGLLYLFNKKVRLFVNTNLFIIGTQ